MMAAGNRMKHIFVLVGLALLNPTNLRADKLIFADDFKGQLGPDWKWVREHREAWRVSERGLEVRIEPGNMWGGANDAKNVLVRPTPNISEGSLEITVSVANQPTAQYEQVDLVWYYADSHMVKLGQELVDGKLCVVMGREENDRTQTIKIVPLDQTEVKLRFIVNGTRIRGLFLPKGTEKWQEVGDCALPSPPADAQPQLSLQFYQGPSDLEHWARVREFRVRQLAP